LREWLNYVDEIKWLSYGSGFKVPAFKSECPCLPAGTFNLAFDFLSGSYSLACYAFGGILSM